MADKANIFLIEALEHIEAKVHHKIKLIKRKRATENHVIYLKMVEIAEVFFRLFFESHRSLRGVLCHATIPSNVFGCDC